MTHATRIAGLAAAFLGSQAAAAGELARIEVTPAFVTLGPGETQAYTATGYDEDGNVLDISPLWVASSGHIGADGLFTADATAGQQRIEARASGVIGLASVKTTPAATVWPEADWVSATPGEAGLDEAALARARTYALTGGGSGFIARGGARVYSWGSASTLYDVKSTTKSIGGTVLGLAIGEGRVRLEDRAQTHLAGFGLPPDTNAATGWLGEVTLLQLATHTAGFAKPGGYTALQSAPGTRWTYSDGGANWLADVLTEVYGQDLRSVLFAGALTRLGISASDFEWRANAFREDTLNGVKRRELAAGMSVNVDAMARVGQLYLRRGLWKDARVLPESFLRQLERPLPANAGLPVTEPADFPAAPDRYGVLWWTNADGALAKVPLDAYWAWGLGDSLIVVIPSLDLVIARAGEGWRSGWNADYSVLAPFLEPIAESVTDGATPLVSAGADLSLMLPAREASLRGAAMDTRPGGSALATAWSVVSGEGVAIAAPDRLATLVSFPGAGEYVLRLTAADGDLSSSDDIKVVVTAPPAPTVTLTASASRVSAGSHVTLNWSSNGADACTASSGWAGVKAATGSEALTVARDTAYVLDCTGAGGTARAAVNVGVDPTDGAGGGGGGVLGGWFIALLLARLRRGLRAVPPSAFRLQPSAFAKKSRCCRGSPS